ncbi:MAG: DUF2339 domain-containing protein [Xanthomonadaceae bacterium]|nr:DUF2339 domain-containing protein [Xanthomonadaceae bacterium]
MPAPDSSRPGFPIVWILLFAALAALALEQVGAVWLGGFCGYLFGRLRIVDHDLRLLAARLDTALRAPPPSTAAADATANREAASPVAMSPTAATAPGSPAVSATVEVDLPAALAAPEPMPDPTPEFAAASDAVQTPAAPTVSLLDGLIARVLDWARGGNPLARLGVLITFVGAVYLIRYAAGEGWLPVELRLAGLSFAALAMVATGWRLRDTVSGYALTLQGGGLALLYLTVLAALRLYALLPSTLAFALLVLVAGASAGLAVRQNALPLAIIGFAGGFVAPLMLGGDGSHLLLFGYYTVLNLGVFAVAAARGWGLLNLLGFTFTFVITSLWRATAYRPEWFASFECFLLLFFMMYVAVTVLSARSSERRGVVSGSLIFGLPAIVLSLQASLVIDFPHGLAISAAGFGVFYLLVAAALLRSARAHWQTTALAFMAIGVVLLSLAVPLYWDDQAIAATWALEGAGAVWLGLRQQRRWTLRFGVVIQLLAGASLLIAIGEGGASDAWFATGVPGALLLVVAGFASGCWLWRARGDATLPRIAAIWALVWWLFAGMAQIAHRDPAWATGLDLAHGALSVTLLAAVALRLGWYWLLRLGELTALLFALGGLAVAIEHRPSYQGGALGWLLLLVVHFAVLRRSERTAGPAPHPASHLLPALLKVWLGALELAWHLRDSLGGDWPWLAYGWAPATALAFVALFPRSWPMARHARLYALGVAAPLALWLLGWIVIGALYANGNAAPLPTWPLMNPLDVTVLAVAAVLWFAWRHRDPAHWDWLAAPAMPGFLRHGAAIQAAIAVFAWLNGALVRGLHYTCGTPLKGAALFDSALLQACVSVVWSLIGCGAMWIAARRGLRGIWLVGAALMVVVAIKLFAVDTAGTGTLARIAAFLFVGAILLAAGYFAPLPVSRDGRQS